MNRQRNNSFQKLSSTVLDTLVIGGGIVGSGIARDCAMRGLKTGLVDMHDFSFGTSSRSSRLLHGGLRYLEQGRVGLVREASLEKRVLSKIAPHLAEPMGFVFPTYKGARPLWQLFIGVKLYDLLCSGKNFSPSCTLSRAKTKATLPALRDRDLVGAVRYFDALTNDSRLVIDTLRSAEKNGAVVRNYTKLVDTKFENGHWVCSLEDRLEGTKTVVKARTLVNAAGPWAEDLKFSSVKLRLSKGIHLVVERSRLPVPDAVVITEGKRIIFIIPWGERLIIGTTDTDYKGAPEDVRVEPEDIAYVLKAVNGFFPSVALKDEDIVSSWAGLRPLLANPDGTPSDISRNHQISSPKAGWWDVSGGKLTTYRLMAEQTVDKILAYLKRTAPACCTAAEPLLPAKEATLFSGILPAPFERRSVEHYLDSEWAISLVDVMVRRSGWHYYYRDASARAEKVSQWMAELCGWTEQQRQDELAAYAELSTPLAAV